MSQPDNPAVPRFTSFRPKPPPSRKPQAAETPEHLHAPRERDHRHKYRPHQDHSKTSDAHESRRRHLRTGILLPNQEIPDVKRRPRSELEPSSRSLEHNQFTIDHKGDPQNLAYGRLHKYDVPQYRRSGHGRVLGLDTISRIDREASGESHVSISIPLLTNQSDQRILSSKAHKEFHSFRLVLPEHDRDSFDPDHDYLPLSRKRSTKRAPALSVLIEPIAENFQGKSPQGNLDSHGSSPESDIQTNSQDSDAENEARIESADEAVKSRNVLLSRLTATEPDNLSAWTDLIEHQEAMLMLGRSRNSREVQLNASERRTLADMRAIMYEKAIRACKTNRKSRIHLMVSQMEEIAEFWDGEKLSEKWQDLLHAEPDAAELWIKYLDFVQSDFTRFRYESCQAAFMKCLEVISSNITGANEQKEPFEALMELFVHVFARMTAMQQQAGYTEHALAHWQGVVEFSLYKPKALEGAALDKQIRAFEEFWDSEVPRLGEADAHGWGAFYDNEGEAPVPQSTEEAAPVQTGDGFADFGKSERALSEIHSRPGRTLDEAGQTDPYHIILFSDIHGMLDLLPYQLPAELLLQTLLCFFGLPLNPNYPNLVDQLSLDPFLMPKLLQASKGGTQGPHLGVSFYRQTTETLFSDAFNELDSNRHLAWARRSIESFVTIMPASDALAEYYVAFMSAQERMTPPQSDGLYKSASKIAKGLLKSRSSNLKLYNAYGITESRSGRPQSADRVFATAIAMSSSLPEDQRLDILLLWRTWIWECLRRQAEQEARSRILSVGDSRPTVDAKVQDSPATRLKARNTLAQFCDLACSRRQFDHAIHALECLALLAYLDPSGHSDLAAALSSYKQSVTFLQGRGVKCSSTYECLHQARAQLLAYHIDHRRPFKPAVIRDVLLESVSLFPNNTMFLNLCAASRSRFSIEDRVHGVADELLSRRSSSKTQSVVTLASDIASEMQRSSSSSGTQHAVRAAFERAIDRKAGKCCPALWQAYLDFETSQDRPNWKLVKDLFFRGLTQLPWCKDFILRAFSDIRTAFTDDELRRVFNVMEEKELRLHSELNDFI